MWLISPIMALWSWKALLRFSRCWLWKGPVGSRCSAGEQPGQQVAWTEQVRGKPGQLSRAGQLRPGLAARLRWAGLEPGGDAALGSLGAGSALWGRLSPRDALGRCLAGSQQDGGGAAPAGAKGKRLNSKEGSWQRVGRGCCCLALAGPPAGLSVGWAFAQAAKRPHLHRKMSSAPCRSEFHIFKMHLLCKRLYSILDVQIGASFTRTA